MLKQIFVVGFLLLVMSTVLVAQEGAEPVDEVIVLTVVPPPETRPVPTLSLTDNGVTLELYRNPVEQGSVILARLIGAGLQEARALFVSREFEFIQSEDGWYAFVVATIDSRARDYPLAVVARGTDGVDRIFETVVTVSSAAYPRLTFTVPSNIGFLINPEVERGEFARIAAVTEIITPERFWSVNGWQLPIDSPFTSAFGQYRVLNDSTLSRHTGWDQRAPVGTPVSAIGDGRVAFAGQLDIRGNYVMLDHGWGVYSGYAHFSQMMVERGQTISKGQIIGMSGNTGRSSGPHLHWEIVVNGEWVDSISWLETWLP